MALGSDSATSEARRIHNCDQRIPVVEFEHPALVRPLRLEQHGATSPHFVQGTSSVTWPTAPRLARYLCDHPHLVRDCSVLELGSGLGLVGAAAAALGATPVVLTDCDIAVPLLQRNQILLNDHGIHVEVAQVNWGSAEDHNAVLAKWGHGFDVLLLSDVVHAGLDSEQLFASCCSLVSPAMGAKLIVGYEFRDEWETIGNFIGWAEAVGFDCSFVPLGSEDDDNEFDGMLYTFTRRPNHERSRSEC